jgi:hypothetical protein
MDLKRDASLNAEMSMLEKKWECSFPEFREKT